ncbi:hypothetical protein GCM10011519_25800 [Marmoricola endophyticus]|uniref:Thioesterase n=1 Tax=Marmoricola endophyticus TaxID=2040280 RepID=A0A917F5P4_9ACTN|nr:thioesterase family protein [Marmoricola endophyticus]GGF50683.1 hypothetical protein GCM10011519_25800 [Marmoricola endophyticus]
MTHPSYAEASSLPLVHEQTVPAEFIDQNGHMNIVHFFSLGSHGAWRRLQDLGMGEDYIERRGSSFFTVAHHIDYLSELREGQRLTVHSGVVERNDKAARSLALVLDPEHERLACALEVKVVHVSMETRRASTIPDDIAAALDTDVADHPWLVTHATGLTLAR